MADRRPPGRPPLQRGDTSVSVHVRLPASQYNALNQRVHAERLDSVPELIRRTLAAAARDDDESDED